MAKSNWLLNEVVAFVYRAYATLERPLTITAPRNDAARDVALDAGATRHG